MGWQDAPLAQEQAPNAPAWQSQPLANPEPVPVNPHPLAEAAEAHGFFQTVKAGAESSVAGLAMRGKVPDQTLPKDAGFIQRQEYSLAQMIPDLPVMFAGAVAGAPVGAAAGGAAGSVFPAGGEVVGGAVGGVAGAGAGAFMLPTALRETLMDHYQNGSVESFQDLWNRALPIMMKTLKSGVVGAATAGVGLVAKPVAEAVTAPLIDTVAPIVASGAKTAVTVGAQALTLATTGAALDGHAPTRADIEDAGIAMLGFHAAIEGAAKVRTIYAKTGIGPGDLYQDVQNNPDIKQDVLSKNIDVPNAYAGAVAADAPAPPELKPGQRTISVPGYGDVTLDQNHDIPWTGGSSTDGKTVFAQKGIELTKNIDGKEYDFAVPLGIHELVERQHEDEGETYEVAHKQAEAAEDAWVQQNWPEIADKYEDHWKQDIQFSEDRAKSGDVDVPADLVVKPYEHPDNPLEEEMHNEVFGGGAKEPPTNPDEPMSTDDARNAILDRVSIGESGKTKPTWSQRYDGFMRGVVDELYPLKKMVSDISGDTPPKTANDPGKLAQLMNGVSAKADGFMKFGTRDFDTYAVNGKGLQDILKPVNSDLDGFRAYWVAKRAQELAQRDIKTGIPLDAAKTLTDDPAQAKKYEPILDDLRQYRENLLNYGKDILGAKNIEKMLSDHPNYAPFNRVMDKAMSGSTGAQPFNPIKAIKGSERTLIDPLESLIKQTYQIVALTERNAVNKAIAELPSQFPDAKDYVQKVPRKMYPIDVQADEISAALEKQGIKGDPDAFTIFRPNALTPAPNQIAVFTDGKRALYQVPDDVAAAVKGLDRETVAPWVKVLGLASKGLRIGTTLTPEFQLRHALRMGVYSFLYSDKLELPFTGLVRGALGVLTKDPDYQLMNQAGAAHANVQSFDREYLQGTLDDAVKEADFIDKSSWNVVGKGISKLQGLSTFMDTAWRLGEFKSVKGDDTGKDVALDAAYKARTVIVDLAQSGARMKALNSITAFQQTIINDSVRMMTALKNEPMKVLPRIAAGIVLPSVLLWAANRKNEAVQNAADWEKDQYWLIPTGNDPSDPVLRYPKPFGVGELFGSGVERALDYAASQDPKSFDHFAKDFIESFVPTELPNFVTPMIEQFANKSMFTGGPIIPHDREKMLPAYQFTPYTSETAKAIGKLIGLLPGEADKPGSIASPAIIENYVRSWTGTMGQYALAASDYGLRKAGISPDIQKPTDTLSDIPFVRAFVARYPSSGAQPIQDYYEHLNEIESVKETVAKLTKEGDFEGALKVQQEKLYDLASVESIGEAMKNAGQIVRQTYTDPNMSPDDKRQIIDSAYFQMIEMAKAGNQMYDETRKAVQEAK